jgi:hypothetical protein
MYAESSMSLFCYITRRKGGEGVSKKYIAIQPYHLILQTHHKHTQRTRTAYFTSEPHRRTYYRYPHPSWYLRLTPPPR